MAEGPSEYPSLHTSGFKTLHTPIAVEEAFNQVRIRAKYTNKILFRIYVPGGTNRVTFILLLPASVEVGAVVRLGLPPQEDYPMDGEYNDYPWEDDNGAKLSEIGGAGIDYAARNYGGHITLVNDSTPSTMCEWLYVKLLKYEPSPISTVKFTAYVDLVDYTYWYENFDNWDDNGNPLPLLTGEDEDYVPVLIFF